MTQTELARTAGVTQSAVAKWESGDSTPSPETIHALGFALGAALEETLALASAQNIGSSGVPDEPELAALIVRNKYLPSPLELKEVVSLGWEAEIWRRATRDARWEPLLARILAYRANQFVLDGRFDEIPALAGRALRLATTLEGRVETVPAVSALAFVAEHRGESPEATAQAAQSWAARIPDSEMRGWAMRLHGMSLVRMGRAEAGLDLVRRSIDLDETFFDKPDEGFLWRTRTMLMVDAYLAAGMPERAAEAIGGRRKARTVLDGSPRFDQLRYVQAEHACGRAVSDHDLEYARFEVFQGDQFAYGDWWTRKRLERVERIQARLLGQPLAA